jgi:membrane peptidoglycan carboxypeptidase
MGLLVAFLVVCVAAGVLFSGLFLPAAAGAGFLTRSGAEYYDDLPTELDAPPLSERSTILAADGSLIATIYAQNRVVVPLSTVNQTMIDAIIAIEDSRFYEHTGVDARGTMRAFLNNIFGGSQQGASTLTQQYVKNVLLEAAVREGDEEAAQAAVASSGLEGYQRKLREARYALALEEKYSKDEILERYLNISNFGDGAYGIFAASQQYFQIDPSQLTVAQAAFLAGIVQQPAALDPGTNPDGALERRNVVLARMLQIGKITQAQYNESVAQPLGANPQQRPNGCAFAGIMAYFCSYVIEDIIGKEGAPSPFAALGETPADRASALYNGGLTITTTIRPPVQAIAWEAVRSQVTETDRAGVALPVVQPGTGQIIAMAQNRIWPQRFPDGSKEEGQQFTEVNYSTGGSLGFQPGSTFKPFTLARWLETSKPLSAVVSASSPLEYTNKDFPTCVEVDNQEYRAGNAGDSGGADGTVTVLRATFNSINTAYMRMAQQLNLCEIRDLANRLGVYDLDPSRGGAFDPYPSMVLGVGQVSPLAMTNAYATFAAEGLYCPPTAVTAISDRDGAAVDVTPPACSQQLDPEVARGVNYALQQVPTQGTARSLGSIGRPYAGKTGTTQSFFDTWFAGYTPNLAAVVWIGDSEPQRIPLTEFPINGLQRGTVYGSTYALPTWGAFMPRALETMGLPPDGFAEPGSDIIYGPQVRVPNVVGASVGTAEARLAEAGLTISVSGERRRGGGVPEGLIASQSPRGGGIAPTGSVVTVYLSDGSSGDDQAGGREFLRNLIDAFTGNRRGGNGGNGNGPPAPED